MTMRFRNLDFDPSQPMDQWPAEAIETVIDRGALSDWRRLAQTIRHNPWGPAARTAEIVTGWGEHYGVDALINGVIARAREDVARRGRAEYAAQIRSWRTHTGMSLSQFSRAAGPRPPGFVTTRTPRLPPPQTCLVVCVMSQTCTLAESVAMRPQQAHCPRLGESPTDHPCTTSVCAPRARRWLLPGGGELQHDVHLALLMGELGGSRLLPHATSGRGYPPKDLDAVVLRVGDE